MSFTVRVSEVSVKNDFPADIVAGKVVWKAKKGKYNVVRNGGC